MKCPICNSPYKAEIEQMYFEGFSPREIAVYIENTKGVSYSPQSILNHCRNHVDIESVKDFVVRVDSAINKLEGETKRLETEKIIEEIIKDANILRKHALQKVLAAEKPREVEVYTALWQQAARRTLEAIKQLDSKSNKEAEELLGILEQMWGSEGK